VLNNNYPISLPATISLSTVITERLSLSSMAASIIPCDSTPHILRDVEVLRGDVKKEDTKEDSKEDKKDDTNDETKKR
jgi:hypothetical protein